MYDFKSNPYYNESNDLLNILIITVIKRNIDLILNDIILMKICILSFYQV